jgi:hypothetical protein
MIWFTKVSDMMNIHFKVSIYMGEAIFKSVKWEEEYYVYVDVLTIRFVCLIVKVMPIKK